MGPLYLPYQVHGWQTTMVVVMPPISYFVVNYLLACGSEALQLGDWGGEGAAVKLVILSTLVAGWPQ